jgi:hypothetical protein
MKEVAEFFVDMVRRVSEKALVTTRRCQRIWFDYAYRLLPLYFLHNSQSFGNPCTCGPIAIKAPECYMYIPDSFPPCWSSVCIFALAFFNCDTRRQESLRICFRVSIICRCLGRLLGAFPTRKGLVYNATRFLANNLNHDAYLRFGSPGSQITELGFECTWADTQGLHPALYLKGARAGVCVKIKINTLPILCSKHLWQVSRNM